MDNTVAEKMLNSLKIQLFFERVFLVTKTRRTGNDLKDSWILSIYAFAVLVTYGICVINKSQKLSEFSWANSYLWYSIASFSNFINKISYISVVIILQMQSNNQITLFKKITEIDSFLWNQFGKSVDYTFVRRRIIGRTTISFVNVFLITVGRTSATINFEINKVYQIIFNMIPFYLEAMTSLWILFAFVTHLDAIRNRFILLAHLLNQFTKTRDSSVIQQELRTLIFIHTELINSIAVMCSIYGFVLIIHLGGDFVDLLVSSYVILAIFLDATPMPSLFLPFGIFWICVISIKFTQIFVYAELVMKKVI